MGEIWKDIEGYEGIYQISNIGRVKSFPRRGAYKTEYILNPQITKKGYCRVRLCNNSSKMYMIHRLVAQAFIPNTDNLPFINHKDENKKNNNVDNLEWCTNLYNIHYGTSIERMRKSLCKPIVQYSINGEKINDFPSAKAASDFINGFPNSITACCKGKLKTSRGYVWKYKTDEL
jgi:hypothetical protein